MSESHSNVNKSDDNHSPSNQRPNISDANSSDPNVKEFKISLDDYDESETSDSSDDLDEFCPKGYKKSARAHEFQRCLRSSSTTPKTKVSNRPKRKKISSGGNTVCCPNCGLTIRVGDLREHLQSELQKLHYIGTAYRSRKRGYSNTPLRPAVDTWHCTEFPQPSTSGCNGEQPRTVPLPLKMKNETYKDYLRIKANRKLRYQSKRWESHSDDVCCPICEESVAATCHRELEEHVETCLRRHCRKDEDESSTDEEVDVEGDAYEWCGVWKVRMTSLLRSQGQLEALGTRVLKSDENEAVEVCVTEDTDRFGTPQYSDGDLLRLNNLRGDEMMELSASATCRNANGLSHSNEAPIIEALEERIHELENNFHFMCLICHGPYETPLVSIVCWHVYCEKCWLQSLATQKLCPQCKLIVSPSDLRKIFL